MGGVRLLEHPVGGEGTREPRAEGRRRWSGPSSAVPETPGRR
ncbi:hypothetical protein SFR_2705 [Streptomyces sp. FR-008]|nr:hypothetical protein SFR_2705 [Streptomyces sp. FR-008]